MPRGLSPECAKKYPNLSVTCCVGVRGTCSLTPQESTIPLCLEKRIPVGVSHLTDSGIKFTSLITTCAECPVVRNNTK